MVSGNGLTDSSVRRRMWPERRPFDEHGVIRVGDTGVVLVSRRKNNSRKQNVRIRTKICNWGDKECHHTLAQVGSWGAEFVAKREM